MHRNAGIPLGLVKLQTCIQRQATGAVVMRCWHQCVVTHIMMNLHRQRYIYMCHRFCPSKTGKSTPCMCLLTLYVLSTRHPELLSNKYTCIASCSWYKAKPCGVPTTPGVLTCAQNQDLGHACNPVTNLLHACFLARIHEHTDHARSSILMPGQKAIDPLLHVVHLLSVCGLCVRMSLPQSVHAYSHLHA